MWFAHGSNDNLVNPEVSRSVFRTLAGLDPGDPIPLDPNRMVGGGPTAQVGSTLYTEVTGGGHGITPGFYRDDQVFEWLFAQSLTIPEPAAATLAAGAATATSLLRVRRRRAAGA